jgi:hypothetical protein
MHREPGRRYQTAAAFQGDLHAVRYRLGERPMQEEEATGAWELPTRPFARFHRPVEIRHERVSRAADARRL